MQIAVMQVLAVSATYTTALQRQLEGLMRAPQRVMLASEAVSLLGVQQFYDLLEGDAQYL